MLLQLLVSLNRSISTGLIIRKNRTYVWERGIVMAYVCKYNSDNWIAIASGYDVNGKRHTKSKGSFPTKQAAKRYAAMLDIHKYDGSITDSAPTFKEYFDNWFETYKKGSVSLATEKRYQNDGKFIGNYFKNKKLSNVNRYQYQVFLNKFGKDHAPSTVRKFNGVIRQCVKNAIIDGLINKDFTDGIKLGGNDDKTLHVKCLNVAEIVKLIQYLKNGRQTRYTSCYMILTAIYTGMRLGEIMALTWDDINFNFKTITINKSWNYLDGGGFKKTKTESSVRTIRVNDDLLNLLTELKGNDEQMVFRNSNGQMPSSNAVNHTLRKIMHSCGLSKNDFHFHSLRHSHVAYLLANDVPLYAISKRLGQSNTTITANKYAYLIDEFKARSDEMISNSLDKIKPKRKQGGGLTAD